MILKILDKTNSLEETNYEIISFENANIIELKLTTLHNLCFEIYYLQKDYSDICNFTFRIPFEENKIRDEEVTLGRKILDCILDMSFNTDQPYLEVEKYWIEEFQKEDWITIGSNQIIIDLTLK